MFSLSGDRAWIVSPVFEETSTTTNCNFAFYVHLTTQNEGGGLFVYSRTEDRGPLTLLWQRSAETNHFSRYVCSITTHIHWCWPLTSIDVCT